MMETISWILQHGDGLLAAAVLAAWLWLGGEGANERRERPSGPHAELYHGDTKLVLYPLP